MKWTTIISALLLATIGACAPSKEYMKDWQSMDAPQDQSKIFSTPKFPEAGRTFEVRRTFPTPRKWQQSLETPWDGYEELLKVVDNKGTLEFWRDGNRIHTIKLGECFSFAELDQNHDFANWGPPAYLTVAPDCRVWDGRKWNMTYRTRVRWKAPCVYEAKPEAIVFKDGDSWLVRTRTSIVVTMERDGSVYSSSSIVEYDPKLKFFKSFDNGYVGSVRVLREIF